MHVHQVRVQLFDNSTILEKGAKAVEQWKNIRWQRRIWTRYHWQQLTGLLNSGPEFHLLRIQYPYLVNDLESGCMYEIPRSALPDPHWYVRAAIQRTTYGVRKFSIHFSWEAGFSDKRKEWVWIDPPEVNGESVSGWSFIQEEDEDEDYYPYVVETSHGDLLRLGEDTIAYPEYSYHVDPLVDVRRKDGRDGQTDGGLFIVPPDYRVKLFVNQIRSRVRV